MLPPGLQTAREVTLYYDACYERLVGSGQAVPFLYPWAGIGAFIVFGYLLIDHRKSLPLRRLRFPLFAFLFAFQTWCIITNKAKHPAGSFGIGLISAWGTLYVFSILVLNDCQTEFARIERTRLNSFSSNRVLANGGAKHDSPPIGTLYWQSFPASIRDRLDWVADAFCSFRGVGWNWQTSGVPPLPKAIEVKLCRTADEAISQDFTISKTGIRRFASRRLLLKNAIVRLIWGYIALDIIKTIMHRDPYFWGYTDAAPPAYLPNIVHNHHVLTKSYRLTISLAGIYVALGQAFALGPVFFCGFLGPKVIGVRGEPWMNPMDMFGSYKCVLEDGLAGWWGEWWHQTFRFAFEAPAKSFLQALNIDKRSTTGRTLSLFVAFFLSGCLHASGSYTQMGETRPLMGPMRFFLLQALGILTQTYLSQQLRKAGYAQKVPRWLKQGSNFVLVHVWLYFTAPLLVDDFAKGGIWLFEPIPISPLRGLGFGAKDDSWFCWWNGLVFWRSGKHWWDTGIAL